MSGNSQLLDQIEVTILAATDAVFIPDRDPNANPRHQVISERRRTFPDRGIPWSSDRVVLAANAAERKRVQRSLERLEETGTIETFQGKTKTVGVRLTEDGERHARALIGLPQLGESLPLMRDLLEIADDRFAREFLGPLWMPETVFAGVQWGDNERRKAFVAVEDQLLPALVRDLVESNCSIYGHCYYRLTVAGYEFMTSGPQLDDRELPEVCEDLRVAYFDALSAEQRNLANMPPENDRDIGSIPMPVSPMPNPRSPPTSDPSLLRLPIPDRHEVGQ